MVKPRRQAGTPTSLPRRSQADRGFDGQAAGGLGVCRVGVVPLARPAWGWLPSCAVCPAGAIESWSLGGCLSFCGEVPGFGEAQGHGPLLNTGGPPLSRVLCPGRRVGIALWDMTRIGLPQLVGSRASLRDHEVIPARRVRAAKPFPHHRLYLGTDRKVARPRPPPARAGDVQVVDRGRDALVPCDHHSQAPRMVTADPYPYPLARPQDFGAAIGFFHTDSITSDPFAAYPPSRTAHTYSSLAVVRRWMPDLSGGRCRTGGSRRATRRRGAVRVRSSGCRGGRTAACPRRAAPVPGAAGVRQRARRSGTAG